MQIKVYGEQWLSTAACGFEPDDDKWEILREKNPLVRQRDANTKQVLQRRKK
jgi:hypothetical protein